MYLFLPSTFYLARWSIAEAVNKKVPLVGSTCGSRLTLGQDNPEADTVVVSHVRVVVVTVRRPAGVGPGVPVAATKHAVRARDGPLRVGHVPAGIRAIPVLTPFPDAPDHVIQSPSVRCVATYRRRLLEVNPAG